MKRITISVPDVLGAALERESRRRLMPMSEIVRDAIAIHLARIGRERIVDGKRVVPFAGISGSGRTGLSQRIGEHLAEERTKDHLIDRNR